jgi:hypothetical protein
VHARFRKVRVSHGLRNTLGRCCQLVRSLIASKEITGISGRAKASLVAKWLLPTPFAPVMMIFFNQDSLFYFEVGHNKYCSDSQRQLSVQIQLAHCEKNERRR